MSLYITYYTYNLVTEIFFEEAFQWINSSENVNSPSSSSLDLSAIPPVPPVAVIETVHN